MSLFDYNPLIEQLSEAGQEKFAAALPAIIEQNFDVKRWGDIPRWQQHFDKLPHIKADAIDLGADTVSVTSSQPLDENALESLKTTLLGFHPWRKGPFDLFGVFIDTEWRSDLKWQRLAGAIAPLEGKTVLDVGCGSGYHCWRMRGAGASRVIGVEPGPLFNFQFQVLQKYIQDRQVHVIPGKMEELPEKLGMFDTVFSMGLLYHRRSPFDHLFQLKEALAPGGQLLLETLVIDAPAGESLVPSGRYAKMGNVWFIPSPATLEAWLLKAGFTDVQCIDVTPTTTREQRTTEWMTFQSLADFLDPDNPALTAEGYPGPIRAMFLAKAPE
jgi:tRNA (mo5U34)-methyltransferase